MDGKSLTKELEGGVANAIGCTARFKMLWRNNFVWQIPGFSLKTK